MVARDLRDLVARAEHQRHALVQRLGLEVEDTLLAVGCRAAGLLDQEGDRVGLVDQAQAAVLIARTCVGWVEEDSAARQAAARPARSPSKQKITRSLSLVSCRMLSAVAAVPMVATEGPWPA